MHLFDSISTRKKLMPTGMYSKNDPYEVHSWPNHIACNFMDAHNHCNTRSSPKITPMKHFYSDACIVYVQKKIFMLDSLIAIRLYNIALSSLFFLSPPNITLNQYLHPGFSCYIIMLTSEPSGLTTQAPRMVIPNYLKLYFF